jgi:hypothetical protein
MDTFKIPLKHNKKPTKKNYTKDHRINQPKLSRQQLIDKHNLPKGLLKITNSGIHNLTAPQYGLCEHERVITDLEELVLSLGPDFIPTPPPITDEDLVVSLIDYKQRVRKKYSNIVNNSETNTDPLGKLFLQSKAIAPPTDNKCGSKPLEHYLSKIHNAFLPPISNPTQLTPQDEFIFYTNHPLDQTQYTINFDNIQRFVEHCGQATPAGQRVPVTLLNHPPTPHKTAKDPTRIATQHQLTLSKDPNNPNPIFTRAPHNTIPQLNKNIISEVLDRLRKDKSIVINNTDKNLGLAIMPTSWYIQQAEEHLKNPLNYIRIHTTPSAIEIFDILIAQLQWLDMYDKYKSPLSKYLFSLDPRLDKTISPTAETPLSTFYMLPKVHKPNKIATRPIVASIGSLTYNASKYVDFVLQKVIRFFPSILLNSLELNRHIALTTFPKNIVLFSSDVSALYPSIDIKDGINALRHAITIFNQQQQNLDDIIDTEFIIALSTWILNNNYLSFGTSTWKQISGTAMGTPMAVVFANLYLLVLEWETLDLLKQDDPSFEPPLLYVRFIDDIFLVARSQADGDLFLFTLGSRRQRIDLETKSGLAVDFLDLTISVCPRETDTILHTAIYQKPMNRYLYIPPFSYHQQSMFKSFIFSEIRRYRASCSLDSDFEHTCAQFNTRLQQRGYDTAEYEQCKQRFQLTKLDILFTGDCKQFYLQQQNGDGINLILKSNLDFSPFRKLLRQENSETAPLLFKLASTPRFSTAEIKANLTLDIDRHGFVFDQFPHALEQFSNPPILCRTRTTKIQDILIRSKFKHDLPTSF